MALLVAMRLAIRLASASSAGFEIASLTMGDSKPKCNKVDHYIVAMHGWFGGEFDPPQSDSAAFNS